jgi:hypothetical protein
MLTWFDRKITLKLVVLNNEACSMQRLGEMPGISASRAHDSIHWLIRAQLIRKERGYRPTLANLKEFILHGIRFAFVPEIGWLGQAFISGYLGRPAHAFREGKSLPRGFDN